jgi:hypothetical protein
VRVELAVQVCADGGVQLKGETTRVLKIAMGARHSHAAQVSQRRIEIPAERSLQAPCAESR